MELMVQSVQSLRVEQKEREAPAELAEQRSVFFWFQGAQQSVCLNKPYVMITYWEVYVFVN